MPVLLFVGKRFGVLLENGETVVVGTDKFVLGVIVGEAFGDQSVVLASEAGLPCQLGESAFALLFAKFNASAR